MFRKLVLGLVVLAAALPLAAETWKNASVIDGQCLEKVKSNPDKHTTKCSIACSDQGYGILTPAGKYLKFDAAGNAKALDAFKATKKTDHLRATVVGTLAGDEIKVESITLD